MMNMANISAAPRRVGFASRRKFCFLLNYHDRNHAWQVVVTDSVPAGRTRLTFVVHSTECISPGSVVAVVPSALNPSNLSSSIPVARTLLAVVIP